MGTEEIVQKTKAKNSVLLCFAIFLDAGESVCKRLVFSGASTAKQLQQFVESNIYHRQGNVTISYAFA